MSVICQYCGFDPVLYKKNTEEAVAKVKFTLEERQKKPESILAKPLHLPTISKERSLMIAEAQNFANDQKIQKSRQGKLLNRTF